MIGHGGFRVKIGSACFATKAVWTQCICHHGKQSSLNHAMYSSTVVLIKMVLTLTKCKYVCSHQTSMPHDGSLADVDSHLLIGRIFMYRQFTKKKEKKRDKDQMAPNIYSKETYPVLFTLNIRFSLVCLFSVCVCDPCIDNIWNTPFGVPPAPPPPSPVMDLTKLCHIVTF